jgi:DNA (cytosine-5)-methyltransferase 1
VLSKNGILSHQALAGSQRVSALRSLELFVGAGGLALGTARAGFKHTALVELDAPCCATLRLNKQSMVAHVRDWEIIEADIVGLDFSQYREIDLLSGGPPCQPFSQGGKRSGRSDSREMFPHFIRAVRECRPKSFIIENVKGLLDRSFSNYFNYIVHQLRFPQVLRKKGEKWFEHEARLECLYTSGKFAGTQYKVIWQVLNAANLGVPQRRQRVFIVGVRADLGIAYSFPTPTHSLESLWLDQWVSGSYWERHRIPKSRRPEVPEALKGTLLELEQTESLAWQTLRDATSDLPNVGPGRTSHRILNHFYNPGARAYHGHDGSHPDRPAKTIKAGHHGVPGGENMVRLDDGGVRYLTVRECARLQGFPDDWAFDGSWCGCMRQIGNAVPVALAEAVAKPLADALLTRLE